MMTMDAQLQNDSEWQGGVNSFIKQAPKALQEWLVLPGSLTQALRDASSEFHVEVLYHQQGQAFESELQLLDIDADEPVQVREVYLHCNNKPWVYARSIIPFSTLTNDEQLISDIGTKPLGHILFNSPNMTRGEFQHACVAAPEYYYERANTNPKASLNELWARRSIFYLSKKPVLVAEVFTSDMPWYFK